MLVQYLPIEPGRTKRHWCLCAVQVAGQALGLNNVPHVVFAPVIGILGKVVKGLLPWWQKQRSLLGKTWCIFIMTVWLYLSRTGVFDDTCKDWRHFHPHSVRQSGSYTQEVTTPPIRYLYASSTWVMFCLVPCNWLHVNRKPNFASVYCHSDCTRACSEKR